MSRLFFCRMLLRNNGEVTYFPARFFLASRLACTPRCCTSKANRGERSIWIINAGHLMLLLPRGIFHQGETRRDAAVTMRARRQRWWCYGWSSSPHILTHHVRYLIARVPLRRARTITSSTAGRPPQFNYNISWNRTTQHAPRKAPRSFHFRNP
jgi:hypothetical protein